MKARKPRQTLLDFVRCAATTKKGTRCPFNAKFIYTAAAPPRDVVDGYCGHHNVKGIKPA